MEAAVLVRVIDSDLIASPFLSCIFRIRDRDQ
jgi:hypothetical protein